MIMKKIFLCTLSIILCNLLSAQLKVDQYGRIGMGTNYPNTEFKCHIKGNLLLTNYPSTPMVELRMKVENTNTAEPDSCPSIGSNRDQLCFWSDWVGFNDVFASSFGNRLINSNKAIVGEIQSPLNTIKQIKSYTYDLNKIDSTKTEKKSYGFLAEDIEKVLPEIIDTVKGASMINSIAIIPILTASINEQQSEIELLLKKIDELEQKIEVLEKTEHKKNKRH